MTDTTILVRLKAVTTQFDAAMKASGRTVQEVSDEIDKSAKGNKQSLTKVGTAATITGGAMFAGFALATKAAMGFDKQMSGVQAVTGATAGELEDLRKAALDAGKATIFSASEAADAEGELAKAGVSTANILGGGLKGALDLAAAGQIDVAEAAEIAATAMTQFKLSGKDVPHIADLLAAAANKAQGGVTDMAVALKYVGPVASQMGVSIEETAGTIALLANNGILADQAGTSLRGMLTALTSPGNQAAATMQSLGINVYDAQGNFIGLEGVAGQLHQALGKLTAAERDEALGRIFGNAQITAARVLYDGGAQAVDKWTKAVDDSGAASRIAATMTDNLAGDLEQLRGAIETALITTGEEGTGVLRGMTQGATDAVNAYTALPGPVKGAASAFAGVGGAGLLAAGAMSLVVPRIVETRAALRTLNTEMPRTARGLGLATKGLAGLAAGFALVETASTFLSKSDSDLNNFVNEITAAAGPDVQDQIDALTARLQELNEQRKGLFFDFGVPFTHSDKRDAADEADRVSQAIKDLQSQQKQQAAQAQASAKDMVGWTTATTRAGDAADGTTDGVQDLKKAMDDLNGATLTQRDAQRGYQSALDDANQALKDNGKTLDIHTQKGRDNAAALDGIATAAEDELVALDASGASAEKVGKRHDQMRRDLVKVAERFGMTKKQAEKYAAAVLSIPKHAESKVELQVLVDMAAIDTHARDEHRAAGGWVGGSGSSTADDQHIWASSHEFVVNAKDARRNAGLLQAINSGASVTSAGAGSGRSLTFAPVFDIDASGSTMGESQFRRIAEDVSREAFAELVREVRAG